LGCRFAAIDEGNFASGGLSLLSTSLRPRRALRDGSHAARSDEISKGMDSSVLIHFLF